MISAMLALEACSASRSDRKSVITELMRSYHDLGQFNGAWLVADASGIVAEGGLGEANREWDIPNTVETKFNLGSITKQFTAALVLTLVDDGLVDLDSTISTYLPEYRHDVGSTVTIHHLLTHTGGFFLPPMSHKEYDAFFREKHTSDEIVRALTGTEPQFAPGTRFSYSSAGYIVLGAIVERMTGLAYGEVLRVRLFDPLGMVNTGIDDNESIIPRRAAGYQTNYGWGNARYKYYPNSFSSGAVYSTVKDLYKWDRAIRDGRILSAASRRKLFQRHVGSHRGSYGYGWFVDDRPIGDSLVPVAFHAGDNSGFSAIIVRSLAADQFVALLTNTEGTHYYEIAFNLLAVLNGADPVEPKAYVADILRHSVYTESQGAVRARYAALTAEGLEAHNTDEEELLELGYDLLYAERPEDAVMVLEITTEIHPSSFDALTSLAEGYEVAGRTVDAIATYERALTLKPGDEVVMAALSELRQRLQ